ncbi:MAG: hypothetical protein C0395_07870 [Gemmatimonas sp.]|nr:hypothetical protein [Gemmatimonas sp.]
MEVRPAPAHSPTPPALPSPAPAGGFVTLDGEQFYRITAYDRLEPFLMTLASDTDLWMFVSSRGGLTAGRVKPDGALFPYVTDDELHDAHHHTGPRTLFRLAGADGTTTLWEPFADRAGEAQVERNLYKNVAGSRLLFEEIDHALGLAFRQEWAGCDEFGWVRTATLENLGGATRRLELLDGLLNVLPHGAPLALFQQTPNLVDAYKKSEIDPATGLGLFSLTAGITDRAEALESLRANVVWCCGLADSRRHLSRRSLDDFRRGRSAAVDTVLNGVRGNYLVGARLKLGPGATTRWRLVCDAGRDHVATAALRRMLREEPDLDARVAAALDRAGEELRRNVAAADGLQATGRPEAWAHHFANVLFNNMRGGIFLKNETAPAADFTAFVHARNRDVASRRSGLLAALPEAPSIRELRAAAAASGDPDLERLALEYLPLHFGRRHGDPSRPWNTFAIRARGRGGERTLGYEGNWRDIFQNWEALCISYPGFLPNVVAKFVNASTVDGFNPYRITHNGVDWETASPADPWSNIGYWGDHQVIYLLRLLELWHRHEPTAIGEALGEQIYVYVEVPYRIKPYAEILKNQRETITYDAELAERIGLRVAGIGADGKLLHGGDGAVRRANLFEKLLVPVLSKLSNLIPDAGIWMNTQRPEWNDANNALAGGGVSVVTLCHLRRFLAFLAERFAAAGEHELPVATEIAAWFDAIELVLGEAPPQPDAGLLDPRDRKLMLDRLGGAFDGYRRAVYADGLNGAVGLAPARAARLCRAALAWVDRSLAANRRDDGLFHGYNLLAISADGSRAEVGRLPVMLEGQVAALDSGALDPATSLAVIEQLFASDLYRPDRRSFLLYPERELPGFLARNLVPGDLAEAVPLLRESLAAGDDTLVARDADGAIRFAAGLHNERDLEAALYALAGRPGRAGAVACDREAVLALYERVFRHRSYTGRSGVMYGYEGLGCIYWHMVAKLLLATQAAATRAERENSPAAIRDGLAAAYFRIRAGLGPEKSVTEYGAFPTDPYSHTPAHGGAKQPGMTGQVKEEILARFGELGVHVSDGTASFRPRLLRDDEFLAQPTAFRYDDVEGRERTIALSAGQLAFTYCQVPIVYTRNDGPPRLRVAYADGSSTRDDGDRLSPATSAELFARSGRVELIEVGVSVPRPAR